MAPKESILAQVARTCDVAQSSQDHAKINEEVLKQRVAEISRDAVEASCKPFRYPCNFANIEEEITFMTLRWLLDFGSGYNLLLVGNVGKTAKEIVQMGVIGMHITSTPTDAAGLKKMHQQTIITLFGVDSHQDADSGIPGVQMSRPGPLSPYTRRLCETMKTAGEGLEEEGHASFGHYIMSVLKDLKASGKPRSAARLVSELAETFPGFEDKALVNGSPVLFLRKAQLLVVDLWLRFGAENELFNFVDMHEVCADSGAAVVAVLRAWGVLECSDALKTTIQSEKDLSSGPEERALRAACVHAVGMMAQESGGLHAWQLSRWLSDLFDKDHDMQPHLTKDIVAY